MSIIMRGCVSTCIAGCRVEHYTVAGEPDREYDADIDADVFFKRRKPI